MLCDNCQGKKWVTECPYCNKTYCVNCFDNRKCPSLDHTITSNLNIQDIIPERYIPIISEEKNKWFGDYLNIYN